METKSDGMGTQAIKPNRVVSRKNGHKHASNNINNNGNFKNEHERK